MGMEPLEINDFDVGLSLIERATTASHWVSQYRGPSGEMWYCKKMLTDASAYCEVLAEELFRLMIPTQPRTYLGWNASFDTYYVLSEAIPGYKPLPEGKKRQFTRGEYPGLGQVLLCSAMLEEIDLKQGNIGLNADDRVVKIDGDWCFASLADKMPRGYITRALIDDLPLPTGMKPYHWLDIIRKSKDMKKSQLVDWTGLAHASHFRSEINEAILRFLLVPDHYWKALVDAIMPSSILSDDYLLFLSERCAELRDCALQNPSFQAYLASTEAENEAAALLVHMKTFVVNGYYNVLEPSQYGALDEHFDAMRRGLFSDTVVTESSTELSPHEDLGDGDDPLDADAIPSLSVSPYSPSFFGATHCILYAAAARASRMQQEEGVRPTDSHLKTRL